MLSTFKFWCNKVLPLVYDDSLSYYEVLCKVVDYINKLIEQDKVFGEELVKLREDLNVVSDWIKNYNTTEIEQIIKGYLATMIFVGLSDSGYIIYNIPSDWDTIVFNTTGLDIEVKMQPEYGHLVLSY